MNVGESMTLAAATGVAAFTLAALTPALAPFAFLAGGLAAAGLVGGCGLAALMTRADSFPLPPPPAAGQTVPQDAAPAGEETAFAEQVLRRRNQSTAGRGR